MRIAKVLGNLTLSRCAAELVGMRWKIVVPLSLDELLEEREPASEELVACDELNAAPDEWVALSEGAEAAMPFTPKPMPLDAYLAAILDSVEISAEL